MLKRVRQLTYLLIIVVTGIYIYSLQVKQQAALQKKYQNSTVATSIQLGGDFTLQNLDGETVDSSAFHGEMVLLYFGYTYCPDICPTELFKMSNVVDELKKKDISIQPLFITIDPERDTKEHLKQYLTSFHKNFKALWGNEDEVKKVADLFHVYYAKVIEDNANDYLVDHSTYIYFLDKNGKFVTLFRLKNTEEEIVKQILAFLEKKD